MLAPDSRTILLVEDDPLLRHDLYEALTDAGFAVRQASDAPEALDMIRESGCSIGLLITDYQLGAMSGVHVAFEFRFQNPLRPIIFITGHDLPSDMRRMSGVMYLRKPFSREDLSAALESLCENEAAALRPPNLPSTREAWRDA
jgi:DNA-binding response OmpR family regulator